METSVVRVRAKLAMDLDLEYLLLLLRPQLYASLWHSSRTTSSPTSCNDLRGHRSLTILAFSAEETATHTCSFFTRSRWSFDHMSQRQRWDRTASTKNSIIPVQVHFGSFRPLSTQIKTWEKKKDLPRIQSDDQGGKQHCHQAQTSKVAKYTLRFQLQPRWRCIAKSHVCAYTHSTVRKRCVVVRHERSLYCEHSRLYCKPSLRPAGGDPGLDHLQKYFFDSLCFLEWTWPFWNPWKTFHGKNVWFKQRKTRRKVVPSLTPFGAARAAVQLTG